MGFGIRTLAFLVDALVYGIISRIVDFLLKTVFNIREAVDPVTGLPVGTGTWIGVVISLVLAATYYVIIPLRTNGQTIGKKIVRIRVKRLDEAPLTAWTLVLRELIGKVLSSATLMIGYLVALGKQKRALHDYLAGTIVVSD
ncbi:MAG TPA: RDD family protein [Bacillota bacterium]|nr:RDD family protein [Bacillota bacterium]